jgi:hypothetical protein
MNRFGFDAERSGAANPKSRSIRMSEFYFFSSSE